MSMSDCSDDLAYDAEFVPRPEFNELPVAVKGRLNALKNLQLNTIKAQTEYFREVRKLDVEFQAKFDEIHQLRAKVIKGSHEPSGGEVEWQSDQEEEEVETLSEMVKEITLEQDYPQGVKGIPKFWLHVLQNVNEELLMGLIEPYDEAVLAHMCDLSVSQRNDGFTINFHFEENPFFLNQVLTKDYSYSEGPDPKAPLNYKGPEIIATKGCKIDWKEGKDLTNLVEKVEKIGAPCQDGQTQPRPQLVQTDSFFDFFNPSMDEESFDGAAPVAHFEIGLSIKEKIIPRAVLYYTGQVLNEIDDDDDYKSIDSDADSQSDGESDSDSESNTDGGSDSDGEYDFDEDSASDEDSDEDSGSEYVPTSDSYTEEDSE